MNFQPTFKIFGTICLTLVHFCLVAQSDTILISNELIEVVVIGEKPNSKFNNLATTNQNLKSGEIEMTRPEKLNDGLALLPSLYIAPDGIGGRTIVLRGYEQNRINIFLNGIPIRSNTEGSIVTEGFFMSSADVSIEKGASSLIYGSNSSGNVIRMDNKLFFAEKFGVKAGMFFGNNGKQNYNLAFHGKFSNKISYQFGANYYKRESFVLSSKFETVPEQPTTKERVNSDQENAEISGLIGYAPNSNHLFSLFAMYNNSEFGYTASIARPRFRRMDDWHNTIIGLRSVSKFRNNFRFESNFYYTHLVDTLNQYTDNTYSSIKSISHWNDQTLGTRIILSKNINDRHSLNASLDYKNDIHEQVWFKTAETKANTLNGTLEYKSNPIERLYLTSGVSYNFSNPAYTSLNVNTERKDLSAFNYQISTAYVIDKASKFHFGYSRNTIFPRMRDLFGDALLPYVPNPNLKVEKSDNFDLGFSTNAFQNKLELSTAFYHNSIQDLLTQIKVTDTSSQVVNLQAARFIGGEVMVKYRPTSKFFTLVSYNYLEASNKSENRTTDFIAYRPAHNLKAFISYNPIKYFGVDFTFSHTAKRYYDNITSWESLPNFSIFDIGVQSKPQKNLTIWFKVNNVFDENYFIAYDQPQPGREYRIGLNVEWNKK